MAIDVQHAVEDDEAALNTTINTTPLVDVMLVMLIIFLVTIPVIVKLVPLHAAALSQYRHGDEAGKYRDRGRPRMRTSTGNNERRRRSTMPNLQVPADRRR